MGLQQDGVLAVFVQQYEWSRAAPHYLNIIGSRGTLAGARAYRAEIGIHGDGRPAWRVATAFSHIGQIYDISLNRPPGQDTALSARLPTYNRNTYTRATK
jgi:hypothetical protein